MSETLTEVDPTLARRDVPENPRLKAIHTDVVSALREILVQHNVTQQELMQALFWFSGLDRMFQVGIALAYLESTVLHNSVKGKGGTVPAVQGPYHRDDHLELSRPYKMPMREDEPGTSFFLKIQFRDIDGNLLSGVRVDMWHSSNDGLYSGFGGPVEAPNLRGIMESNDEGRIEVGTIKPVPYLALPPGTPASNYLYMVGDHPWRPAHFHFKIAKDGFEPLISQIYFSGDPIIEGPGDVADIITDEQIIQTSEGSDPEIAQAYGLRTPYQIGEYVFTLRRAISSSSPAALN